MQDLPIDVTVQYPKQVSPGISYIMTLDISFDPSKAEWPFENEEIPVNCIVSSSLFSIQSPPDPVFFLHRFGSTYGKLSFILKAADQEKAGEITLLLINNGLLIGSIVLETKIIDEKRCSG